MKIHLATDHRGLLYKDTVKEHLLGKGYEVIDHGAYILVEDDDYPDFVKLAAEGVSKDTDDFAIIFGYSGEGEAMVANRYPSVRAAVYNGGNEKLVGLAREHNNANILSIGAHFVSIDKVLEAVDSFLKTPFSGDARHIRRINKF